MQGAALCNDQGTVMCCSYLLPDLYLYFDIARINSHRCNKVTDSPAWDFDHNLP